MKQTESKYQCIPFWSWNDELDEEGLVKQIEWMKENGVGGFFMHARGGLKTEYLGKKWFDCVDACSKRAQELGMEAYAYDENGWPSGFVGGKLLEDIENHDKYLTYTIGAYDENAMVSYSMDGEKLCRVTNGENCLNVFEHYATSTADILNGEVMDKFLAMTHEEYAKRDKYNLKGFFTDEPQYYRWNTSYTKVLPKYFKDTYGEDILDGIGLLFVEKEGYRAFRYKYWKAMQSLMLENFAKKIYDWCDQRGYNLTGHYVEESSLQTQLWCCGGIMPFYEYEHIPGIDWLGRSLDCTLSARQVGSVAAQLGKEQVLTETYGCCGWDVSPHEIKAIAEAQYVYGVNLMCQHLLPYTEHGQRKRDYPAHYSEANPWVRKNFKEFNDYFSLLGKMLAQSKEEVNVAVLHPIRSAYFDYKRMPDDGQYGVGELNQALWQLGKDLAAKQIPYHYLDETLLAKYGKVDGKKMVMGNCAYDFVVLPKIYTMDKTTEKLLREYVAAGGKILLADERPTYLEGEEYEYDYLISNTSYEEMLAAQPYGAAENYDLHTTYRKEKDGKEFIYAVNLGEEKTVQFTLKKGTSFKVYDIMKDEYKVIGTNVHFDKNQSYILYISDETPAQKQSLSPLYLKEKFTVASPVENYLTMDFVRYSFDGKTYSEPLHHMGVFNEMLEKRHEGKLYLKYEFTVKDIPNKCVLFAEDTNTEWVEVNGKRVERCGSSAFEKALYAYDVANNLKEGNNEVVILINYFQSEQVYYALFGENVTESLKNCLAYDTDIEAVYLKGDFGVYGDFEKCDDERVMLGQNFYIGKQKQEIQSLIDEGYPFFSGDIVLKQKINVTDTDMELVIDKRFHLLEVKVNGEYVGKMMFGYRLDLSNVLKVGENEIEIILTVGNRNLLGPFHTQEYEPTSIGPYSFERLGTWTNGKSSILRESYSFVKTLI
ncbi:MAG: hypothetical protein E7366_02340 [Clostridiales bacterium]|nr:hypothetical protein [Clostridiales bacterium]